MLAVGSKILSQESKTCRRAPCPLEGKRDSSYGFLLLPLSVCAVFKVVRERTLKGRVSGAYEQQCVKMLLFLGFK